MLPEVDQILANLYNPGQENAEPLLSDNDVHPLGLLMDKAALSKAPLVLAGLQELSRVPTILSDGRSKNLTGTEDQQGTLQSMEFGHIDQESCKLSESHAAQMPLCL
ncbi:TPA: hypothetical protein ACH3X1_004991 [Trebouxia sp. C0004]